MTVTITKHSRVVQKLIPIIEANPGIESRRMAVMAGLSLSHTKNGLAVISRNHMAGYVELGRKRRGWWLQPEADRLRAGFVPVKMREKMEAAKRPPTAREQIMDMARTHDDGASIRKIAEALDIGRKDAHRHFLQMVKQGRLFMSHRAGCVGRWFDTAEKAGAWAVMREVIPSEFRPRPGRPAKAKPAKVAKPPKAEKLPPKVKPPRIQVIKAKPANDAPVILKTKATDMRGAVDYSRAKIIVCPSPVSVYRYQYDPNSKAHLAYVRELEQLRGVK